MPEEISEELIVEIRYYVNKYNSKINVANKLGVSYDTVCFYTKDIKLKSRKMDTEYSGIYGKSLVLLKELMENGYAFSSKKYNTTHYVKMKKCFPKIRRTKMYGKMIYYLDDKSKLAAKALLESTNKKVISYYDLASVSKVFDINLSKKDKHRFVGKNRVNLIVKGIALMIILQERLMVSVVDFYIREYCKSVLPNAKKRQRIVRKQSLIISIYNIIHDYEAHSL